MGNLKVLHGSFGSKDGTTVSKKQMNGVGADAILGLNFGSFLVGAGGEYIKFMQQSKASDNINLSGTMTNLFGTAGISAGKFFISGKYYFSTNYDLTKSSSSSESVKYNTPSASYGASIAYRLSKHTILTLEYNTIGFSKEVRNGTTSKLESPMQLATYGLSYGFIF